MAEENKGVEENKVEQPTGQNAPADEKKDNQKPADQPAEGEEEKVTLSKKELEVLQKKAADFENSIELKRLSKLAEKGTLNPDDKVEINQRMEKLEQELSSYKATTFNNNLSEAYREVMAENPWLNDDAKFDKIKEKFSVAGTETKEQLVSLMKSAAQTSFPQEYEKHLEDKIKANLLKDNALNNPSGNAGSAEILHKDEGAKKTEEQLRKERLGSMLRANMTWIKNK